MDSPDSLPVTFFLRDAVLASGEAPRSTRVDGDWIFPSHVAYCCPTCGEVWGRVVYGKGGGRRWQFVSRPCEKHTDQMQAGTSGSLVLMDREVEWLPEVLVRYEFGLLLRKFDKGILE